MLSRHGVDVIVGDNKALVFDSIVGDPLEVSCGENPVGMVKTGNWFVFLNCCERNELNWVPEGSFPKISSFSCGRKSAYWDGRNGRLFPKELQNDVSAVIVLNPSSTCRLFVCLYSRSDPDVYAYGLNESKNSYIESISLRDHNLEGIGFMNYSVWNGSMFILNAWPIENGKFCGKFFRVEFGTNGLGFSRDYIFKNVNVSEPVVDVHCWQNSCFFLAESNQIIRVDNYLQDLVTKQKSPNMCNKK